MNNPKHTKGPWHFIETGPIRKGGPKASLLANASPHIHGVCEGISDADARLIAAAPELLSVARELEFLIKKYDIGAIPLRLRQDLKNAITKATGGSNE